MPDQKDNYFCYLSLSASLYRLCENPRACADFLVSEHAWHKEHVSKALAINANLLSDLLALYSGAEEANPARPGDLVCKTRRFSLQMFPLTPVGLLPPEVSRSISTGQNPPQK